MSIFLVRAKHGATYAPPAVQAGGGFGDVPMDASYAAWVKQLAARHSWLRREFLSDAERQPRPDGYLPDQGFWFTIGQVTPAFAH